MGDRDRGGLKTYRTLEGEGARPESCPWKLRIFDRISVEKGQIQGPPKSQNSPLSNFRRFDPPPYPGLQPNVHLLLLLHSGSHIVIVLISGEPISHMHSSFGRPRATLGCSLKSLSTDEVLGSGVPRVNKLKTTPTPNKNGSYGMKGGGGSYDTFLGSACHISVEIP